MGVQHRVSDLPARFVRVARRLQDLLARHFNRRGAQVVRQKLRGNVKKKNKKTKDKKEKQQKQQKGQLTTCCDAVTHSRAFFLSFSLSSKMVLSLSLSLSLSTSYIFIIYTRLSRSLSARLSPAASPSL